MLKMWVPRRPQIPLVRKPLLQPKQWGILINSPADAAGDHQGTIFWDTPAEDRKTLKRSYLSLCPLGSALPSIGSFRGE